MDDLIRMLRVPRRNTCIDCGKQISENAIRCMECSGLFRRTEMLVSRDELKKLIRITPDSLNRKYF